MTPAIPDDELKLDVDAYYKAGGNRSEAARARGIPRQTYQDRLRTAEQRFKLTLGKVVDGRVDYVRARKMPLPKRGQVKRYILSSCQNNTHVHKDGLTNLLAYRDWLGDCLFLVGTFSYAIDAYGAKAVKRGRYKTQDSLWYAPELAPYLCDESIEIAPGLVWCGEMNILPTAKDPLRNLDDYNGRASNIIPHVKHAMESVAALADEATKFNYTTGCITLRNYIQKRAGIIAERKHTYGAVIVEVDSKGNWFVRQLTIDDKGTIYDIGPVGSRAVRIVNGIVELAQDTFVEAITWGDAHTAEMGLTTQELAWGKGGMLDQLKPRKQFLHDIFSMRSRSHHEAKDFHRLFEKFTNGEDSVEDEIKITSEFLNEIERDWCETIVVPSNHDRHLDRWLNEADPAKDLRNSQYFMKLQSAKLAAIANGDLDFNTLEYALRNTENGTALTARFLGDDESYIICRSANGGIECGLHGDRGVNGSRGTTRGLTRLGRAINKGHDHVAAIRDMVYSAGACSLNFQYVKGPRSHSISHIITFENGSRQIVTFWAGKFRA